MSWQTVPFAHQLNMPTAQCTYLEGDATFLVPALCVFVRYRHSTLAPGRTVLGMFNGCPLWAMPSRC